jgi:hypothetical protein
MPSEPSRRPSGHCTSPYDILTKGLKYSKAHSCVGAAGKVQISSTASHLCCAPLAPAAAPALQQCWSGMGRGWDGMGRMGSGTVGISTEQFVFAVLCKPLTSWLSTSLL